MSSKADRSNLRWSMTAEKSTRHPVADALVDDEAVVVEGSAEVVVGEASAAERVVAGVIACSVVFWPWSVCIGAGGTS